MSALSETLELLYSARQRFQTIAADLRYRYRPALLQEGWNRWQRRQAPGSVSVLRPAEVETDLPVELERLPESAEALQLWRVWWDRPARWRQEIHLPPGEVNIQVIDGERWWFYNSREGIVQSNAMIERKAGRKASKSGAPAVTNANHAAAQMTFLDPSALLASHDLEVVGRAVHAGREAIAVRARPREDRDPAVDPGFWASADAYQLLVDAERGVLLRYAASFRDTEYAIVSIESVIFDQSIDESLFAPPTGPAA